MYLNLVMMRSSNCNNVLWPPIKHFCVKRQLDLILLGPVVVSNSFALIHAASTISSAFKSKFQVHCNPSWIVSFELLSFLGLTACNHSKLQSEQGDFPSINIIEKCWWVIFAITSILTWCNLSLLAHSSAIENDWYWIWNLNLRSRLLSKIKWKDCAHGEVTWVTCRPNLFWFYLVHEYSVALNKNRDFTRFQQN